MKDLRVSKKEIRKQKTAPMTKVKMLTEAFSIFWIVVLAGLQLMRAISRFVRLKKAYSSSKQLESKSKAK